VSSPRLLWVLPALATSLLWAGPAIAQAPDPAEQPPFGGEPVPPLVGRDAADPPPPGFELSPARVLTIGDHTQEFRDESFGDGDQRLTPTVATRGDDRWEVRYRGPDGDVRVLVVVDDRSGEVLEAWTGSQVETKLARGYEDAVSGDVNEAWFWLPLSVLFLAPFVDPRRPLRLVHLDLLALLGFSASLFFFNKGEIGVSVPLIYPPLAYLFARALLEGVRPAERRDRLLPWHGPRWLVAGIAGLVVLHCGFAIAQDKVIDVGLAGVVGADRLLDGEDVYGEEFAEGLPSSGDIRGDVYGPVNYLAYVPLEAAWPWDGIWDDLPAARAAALAFDLLTALALFALGRGLRRDPDGVPTDEGRTLGIALAFAWLAYPFTMYTLGSSFNDSLVALLVVCSLLVISSPPGRGAVAALAGLTKFGPLALAPLLAAGTGDRRPRSVAAFVVAFLAVAVLVTVPLLPDGGLTELYDRSLEYQASRGSPFSVWGQAPSLDPLQTATKVFAVVLGLALFFVPRRRSPVQLAGLAAALLIAVQVTSNHWFYPYTVWFAPLVLVAVFAQQRGLEPRERA
jgi:glycosyl transferase family 87